MAMETFAINDRVRYNGHVAQYVGRTGTVVSTPFVNQYDMTLVQIEFDDAIVKGMTSVILVANLEKIENA